MRKIAIVYCILAAASCFGAASVTARTWNVMVDGSGDAPTIQAAIDSAVSGDEILVYPGVYTWANQGGATECGMIEIPRGASGFTIRGVAGAASTILDAQGQGRVMCLVAYNYLTIEGLTFTGGQPSLTPDYHGGGLWVHLCYTVFRDCVITGNSTGSGAGGGLACLGVSSMELVNCEISSNSAEVGGGVFFINSTTTSSFMSDCVVRDNTAATAGGGVYCHYNALTINNTIIAGNSAGDEGGALSIWRMPPSTFTNCTLVGNYAGVSGSGLYVEAASDLTLSNSIVAYGTGYDALFVDGYSTLAVGCTDFYGNVGGDGIPAGVVDNGGNFSADPKFCGSVASYDYNLQGDSPCAPGNHPDGAQCNRIGARPVGCGDVPVDLRTWGAIKAMYQD